MDAFFSILFLRSLSLSLCFSIHYSHSLTHSFTLSKTHWLCLFLSAKNAKPHNTNQKIEKFFFKYFFSSLSLQFHAFQITTTTTNELGFQLHHLAFSHTTFTDNSIFFFSHIGIKWVSTSCFFWVSISCYSYLGPSQSQLHHPLLPLLVSYQFCTMQFVPHSSASMSSKFHSLACFSHTLLHIPQKLLVVFSPILCQLSPSGCGHSRQPRKLVRFDMS